MNVLYLLVSLGKSLTFWQTMDEVIKIFVIVAAIAFAAYQNYAKKEKKRNKPSRKKMAKPATVHVEPDIIMAGQQNECVEQSADNKLNKKRKGEGESIGSYRKKRLRRMRYLLPNSLSQVALSG